ARPTGDQRTRLPTSCSSSSSLAGSSIQLAPPVPAGGDTQGRARHPPSLTQYSASTPRRSPGASHVAGRPVTTDTLPPTDTLKRSVHGHLRIPTAAAAPWVAR